MRKSNDSLSIPLRLPKDMVTEIDELADFKLSSRNQIAREAIKNGLPIVKKGVLLVK